MFRELALNPGLILERILAFLIVAFLLYTIVRALLEVRQIRIVQQKIGTKIDFALNYLNIIYILVQLLIFVIILILI